MHMFKQCLSVALNYIGISFLQFIKKQMNNKDIKRMKTKLMFYILKKNDTRAEG